MIVPKVTVMMQWWHQWLAYDLRINLDASKFYDTIGPSQTRRKHDFKLRPQPFHNHYFTYSFLIVTSVIGILSSLMLSVKLALILSKSPLTDFFNRHTLYILYFHWFYFMSLLLLLYFLCCLVNRFILLSLWCISLSFFKCVHVYGSRVALEWEFRFPLPLSHHLLP